MPFFRNPIEQKYKEKGYAFFSRPFSMNVFGVRSSNRIAGAFDDYLGVIYNTDLNEQELYVIACTLDAGAPWLLKPMDPGGAAGIVPGQYRNLWQLGTFKGTDALIQINPVKIYRDNNRDLTLDYSADRTTEGDYGIFLHEHFQFLEKAEEVKDSSAGCVVPERKSTHKKFINILKMQVTARLGNRYSFTVFDEKDFN